MGFIKKRKNTTAVLFFSIIILFLIISIPLIAYADFFSAPSFDSLVPCGKSSGTPEEMAPCNECHLFIALPQRLLEYAIYLSTFLMILSLIISGGMFVVSSTNTELRSRGRNILKKGVTGFLFVLGAYFIINSIFWVLGREKSPLENNWGQYSCGTTSLAPPSSPTPEIPDVPPITINSCLTKKLISLEIQCQTGTANSIALAKPATKDNPNSYNLKAIATFDCAGSDGRITQIKEDVTQNTNWSIADETIAKVNKQNVQAINAGNTYVLASYSNGTETKNARTDIYVNSCPFDANKNQISSSFFKNLLAQVSGAGKESCEVCNSQPKEKKCEFIAGYDAAPFVFLIGRTNGDAWGGNACKGGIQSWDEKNLNQLDMFNSMVREMSDGLSALEFSFITPQIGEINFLNLFAVYASNAVYQNDDVYDIQNDCRDSIIHGIGKEPIERSEALGEVRGIMVGFIQHSSKRSEFDRAYAPIEDSSKPAIYCDSFFSGNNMDIIFAHEQIGHQFGGLDDEYDTGMLNMNPNGTTLHNCTADSKCRKWETIDADKEEKKCYAGCNFSSSLFRSSINSVMRDIISPSTYFSAVQKIILKDTFDSFPSRTKSFAELYTGDLTDKSKVCIQDENNKILYCGSKNSCQTVMWIPINKTKNTCKSPSYDWNESESRCYGVEFIPNNKTKENCKDPDTWFDQEPNVPDVPEQTIHIYDENGNEILARIPACYTIENPKKWVFNKKIKENCKSPNLWLE